MKISIYGGEAFPVYSVYPKDAAFAEIEVSEETLQRWRDAFMAFSSAQREIIQTLEVQGKGELTWIDGSSWDGFFIDEDEQ